MKILKYITEDINSQEYNFLIDKLNVKNVSRIDKYDNETINSINELFQYAPEPFLENILSTLKNFKALTDKFK